MAVGDLTVLAIAQEGRLQYEALLLLASLRATAGGASVRVVLAEPQPGPLWTGDPRIGDERLRALLISLGAEIVPLHNRVFGGAYPHGNKIEALSLIDGPFVFFDSDTLFLAPLSDVAFDWSRPGASMRRQGTWPRARPGWPGYHAVWQSLYQRFGLDFDTSLDPAFAGEDWRRYLYFNAGWFFHRSAAEFGRLYLEIAREISRRQPAALEGQKLTPWLDQIALPLVIHALGGGRDAVPPGLLDGSVTCHYRTVPLLYARESDAAVEMLERLVQAEDLRPVLSRFDQVAGMVLSGRGRQVRERFAADGARLTEAQIRKRLKQEGDWLR